MEPKAQVPATIISSSHLWRVGRGFFNSCLLLYSQVGRHIVLPPRERHTLDRSER